MRWALSALPPFFLGLAGLFLAAWSRGGRTVNEATLPAQAGLVGWLLFEAIALFTERWPGATPLSEPDARKLRRATANMVRLTAVVLAGLFALVTSAVPLQFPPRLVGAVILGGVFGALGLGLVAYVSVLRQLDLPPEWRYFIYYAPEDSRLWVRKLLGLGWTVNFGHPRALGVMIAFLVLLIALPLSLALPAH